MFEYTLMQLNAIFRVRVHLANASHMTCVCVSSVCHESVGARLTIY